jgi:hypothetical protein
LRGRAERAAGGSGQLGQRAGDRQGGHFAGEVSAQLEAFTLDTYVHLLEDTPGTPLEPLALGAREWQGTVRGAASVAA